MSTQCCEDRARWSDLEKLRSQSAHLKGFTPCRVSSSERANFHVQPSQILSLLASLHPRCSQERLTKTICDHTQRLLAAAIGLFRELSDTDAAT
ncbi:hypothetical protein EYF80_043125 [Liparis tanakae]|uniref:Uncharacterized protein n=1 Tax=Liparis tanakae TaxID=230148 RepID=A0A4Z2FZA9_9TELE|nr:hypothetical protein EYF80_043125 [Liparis tanakae]